MGKKKRLKKKEARQEPASPAESPTQPTPEKGLKGHWLFVLLLSLIYVATYKFVFDPKLDVNGDNAVYFILGKSLAEGKGYKNHFIPNPTPHTQYPVGYPFLTSLAIMAASPDLSSQIKSAKILGGVLFWVILVLFYFLLIKWGAPPFLAFSTAVLLSMNSVLLRFSTIIMSEIPFLLCAVLAFVCFSRIHRSGNLLKDPWFYIGSLSVVAGLYMRAQGITLAVAVGLYLVWIRQWKAAAVFGVGLFLLIWPWVHFQKSHEAASGYAGIFTQKNPYDPALGQIGPTDLLKRIAFNAKAYTSIEIPASMIPALDPHLRKSPSMGLLLGLGLLALMAWGWWKLGKYRTLTAVYFAAVYGICLLWPEVWHSYRFVIGLLPFQIFLVVWGVHEGIKKISFLAPAGKIRWTWVLFWPLIPAMASIPEVQKIHQRAISDYPAQWANYFKMAVWANQNTARDAVVSCRKPALFYLVSQRKAARYIYSRDVVRVIKDMNLNRVDYVVVDNLGFSSGKNYLVPAIKENAYAFDKVHEIPDPPTYLFRSKFSKEDKDGIKLQGSLYNILAYQDMKEKKFNQAVKLYNETINLYKNRRPDEVLGRAYLQLATIFFDIQDYSKSLQLNLMALKIFDAVPGIDISLYNAANVNIGYHFIMQNNHEKALQYFENAFSSRESVTENDYGEMGILTRHMGISAAKLGNFKKAERYYKSSLDYWEKLGPDSFEYYSHVYIKLIEMYRHWGKEKLAENTRERYYKMVQDKYQNKMNHVLAKFEREVTAVFADNEKTMENKP